MCAEVLCCVCCIAGSWAVSALCHSGVDKAATHCAPGCSSAREAEERCFLTVAHAPASLPVLPTCLSAVPGGGKMFSPISIHLHASV